MKEIGMMFHKSLILSLEDGSKTMTRRIINKHNSELSPNGDWSELCWDGSEVHREYASPGFSPSFIDHRAPLPWVDCGFKNRMGENNYQYLHIPYRWSEDQRVYRLYPRIEPGDRIWVKDNFYTKKSTTKLWLDVLKIKPSKLGDIEKHPEDYIKEGYKLLIPTNKEWFIILWDKLNAKRDHSYISNPWVWVIEFKKL